MCVSVWLISGQHKFSHEFTLLSVTLFPPAPIISQHYSITATLHKHLKMEFSCCSRVDKQEWRYIHFLIAKVSVSVGHKIVNNSKQSNKILLEIILMHPVFFISPQPLRICDSLIQHFYAGWWCHFCFSFLLDPLSWQLLFRKSHSNKGSCNISRSANVGLSLTKKENKAS